MTIPPIPSYPPRRPRRRIAIICAAGVAGAIVGITLAAAHTTTQHNETDDTPQSAPNPISRCITDWNQHNTNRDTVARMNTSGGTAYVTVGFSQLFPDKCLITIANPNTMYAQQYMENSGGDWTLNPDWTGSADQLDSSVTDWNARLSTTGIVTLN